MQAGVALGLAKTVSARFPDWGPSFSAVMVSVIILNLMTGPPLFRSAVIASGEARALTNSLGSHANRSDAKDIDSADDPDLEMDGLRSGKRSRSSLLLSGHLNGDGRASAEGNASLLPTQNLARPSSGRSAIR